MKKTSSIAALALAATAASALVMPAQAADVGVSISLGQPGFYGRIDLGNAPRPALVYTQPMWIERTSAYVEPVYLRVPPGHQKNWRRYCHQYGACGQPVYFVRDDWYRNTYVPHYREYYYRDRWQEARRVDRDHDGVPDYRDRDGGTRRDRDNDGIPNRYDRNDGHRDHGRGRGHDRDGR